MTSYILISKSFKGYIFFTFNKAGYLFEFRNCSIEMSEDQVQGFLNSLRRCLTWHLFNAFAREYGYTVLKVEQDLSYDAFDAVYNMARNRYKAEPMWNRLKPEDRTLTIWNVHAYNRYLKRYPKVSKMLPSTYLAYHTKDEWDKTEH